MTGVIKFPGKKNDHISAEMFSKYEPGDAWLIFRLDCMIAEKPADICILLDIASDYVLGFFVVLDEIPSSEEIEELMQNAYEKQGSWPEVFYCTQNDPAKELFNKNVVAKDILFESAPAEAFYDITAPMRESFNNRFASPASTEQRIEKNNASEEDRIMARSLIPDTYDPCPCASGKKFKFCCKPIFPEIIDAMVSAEEGSMNQALKYMDKAKAKAGETPEVLCRYAIIHSFSDKKKSYEYRDRCLALNPNHPRANYILGIDRKETGDQKGAIEAYGIAAQNYPPGDRFHLNEVWNNMGTAYYELGNYRDARKAWEKALSYMPQDNMVRDNLERLIYNNPMILKKSGKKLGRKK